MPPAAPPSYIENSSKASWIKAQLCESIDDKEGYRVWCLIAEYLETLEALVAGQQLTKH
jgi:hypothetical protein